MTLNVIASCKNDLRMFFSGHAWGSLTGVYKTGTLEVSKDGPSMKWAVTFQTHWNYKEEPSGKAMLFVLACHEQYRQWQGWVRTWTTENPHAPLQNDTIAMENSLKSHQNDNHRVII
jgi:hypothetical protein